MIHRSMLILLGALMTAAFSMPGTSLAADNTLTKLENGMNVLVQRDTRFPMVSLRLYVRAGSAYETDEQAGISHLLEHMVFKGTEKRGPGEVAETIEGAGGYLNAATSFDYTVYIIDIPSDSWKLGLDVLQDMVFNVKLDPEELEREKDVVLAELERGEDSPSSLRFKTLQPLLWKGLGYERPIIGYRDTVKSFTRQDILDYINTYYQPQSMLAVVVGDIDPDEALAEVDNLFGDYDNTRKVTPKRAVPVPVFDAPRVTVQHGAWNKTYFAAAFPLPSLHSSKVAGLDMLGHLLGGDETSRLYRKFKYEEGLVDSISAQAMTLDQVGMLYINATLDSDDLDVFTKKLSAELAALPTAHFKQSELDRAHLNIENSLYSTKETIGGITSKIGYFQFFENNVDGERNYLDSLATLTPEALGDLAKQYLAGNNMAVSILLPENGNDTAKTEQAIAQTITEAYGDHRMTVDSDAAQGTRGEPETIDLGKGRTLVLLPDKTLPYTAVTMALPGGDSLLFPDEQGLAELTARSLTKGTGDLSAIGFEDYLSERAASLGASASRDLFVVSAKYPSRFSDDMLPLFTDVLLHPKFEETEVKRALKELTASIHRREDQPTGKAFRYLFPMLYKDSAYSYLHMGQPESIAAFGVKEVKNYWSRQVNQPFVLSVCGDFDREQIIAAAKEIASASQATDFDFAIPEWNSEQKLDLTMDDRNQSHIVVAFPIPGSRHDDSVGLDVLRQALAGQGGMLFRELRDKQGLGYTVTALVWQAPETGFIAFYIGTYPEKTQQALEGFKIAVHDLQNGALEADEVDRSKNLIRGDYYRDHQSLGSRSREAAGLLVRGFDIDHNRKDIDAAMKLTPKDMKKLAAKYLIWDKAYVLTVTP